MKLIIVDDEPKIRNGLAHLLATHCSWNVVGVCETAAEALSIMAREEIDVLITDIKMPEIDGLCLIEKIRDAHRNTEIIILSGYSNFRFAQRAIELGVRRYLTKPTNMRELLSLLEKLEIEKSCHKEKTEVTFMYTGDRIRQIPNLLVQQALEYIHLHYTGRLTIRDIAEHLAITPNYLSELFRIHLQMTLTEYVTGCRMEKACRLLRRPEYRVGDTAREVGFEDVRYFSSLFKKIYSMTPTEYRNQYV